VEGREKIKNLENIKKKQVPFGPYYLAVRGAERCSTQQIERKEIQKKSPASGNREITLGRGGRSVGGNFNSTPGELTSVGP